MSLSLKIRHHVFVLFLVLSYISLVNFLLTHIFGVWEAKHILSSDAFDVAYCLLGLFDINLPASDGEGGPRAFLRLQEQSSRQLTTNPYSPGI